MWGWLVLVVVLVILWKKHQGGSGGGILSKVLGGGATAPAAAPATSPSVDAATTGNNESWGQDAIGYLTSQGYTPSQASSAIGAYTAGGELDPGQATLVDVAVQGVGQPPQLLIHTSNPNQPGGNVAATTGTGANRAVGQQPGYVQSHQSKYAQAGAHPGENGPTDKSGHRAYFQYKVKAGDTFANLGTKFGTSTTQLESWNNTKKLRPGQQIWV
jgi:LysM repeat protein